MIERAIFDRTASYPALNSLQIGPETIHPDTIPEDSLYPAIRYSLVDSPDVASTHDDENRRAGLYKDRYQFDIYSPDPLGAKEIRDALLSCWENFRGVISGVSIQRAQKVDARSFGTDEDSELHRELVEFYFWYSYSQD